MTDNSHPDRRAFLATAGAAAGFMIVKPQLVRGSQANSAVRVGLLGCGGRGTVDATSIATNGPARMVALADLFEDRLVTAKKHFDEVAVKQHHAGVAASQMFQGPRAAERILNSAEVDAVVIATPPYFHPQHLAAAVAAGKHVYCEKPVGVDVAGALRAIESGKQAEGRLSLDVGFQIRKAPPFVELVRRIHAGALGEISCGQAYYYCPFLKMPDYPKASPVELRLRHWLHDRVLSGDIIVEQNIHVVDICNWVLQSHPVKAIGAGGRKGRTESPGDAWSHFDVVFQYPNDVHVSFSSCQFGKAPFDASETLLRHPRQFPIALFRSLADCRGRALDLGRRREARPRRSPASFPLPAVSRTTWPRPTPKSTPISSKALSPANFITRPRWAPNRLSPPCSAAPPLTPARKPPGTNCSVRTKPGTPGSTWISWASRRGAGLQSCGRRPRRPVRSES